MTMTLPVAPARRERVTSRVPEFDVVDAYDQHGAALFGFAVNALRDRPLAEDCVQETFLRAWRARDTFDRDRASERTWLFSIARNVIIDAERARARRPRTVPDHDAPETAAAENDPLERLAIVEGLAKLSDDHRNVIVDIHVQGRSYQEVSTTSGIPIATLRTRAYYALRALRRHLDEGESR